MTLLVTGREPYRTAAERLIAETGCTIRRWRKRTNGAAYTSSDDWGIEVPEPRGPVSFATFAHEVGHQSLHRHGSRPRWREELEAWLYALDQFPRYGLPGAARARADAARSLRYAARKAARRASPETAQAILDAYPDWVWRFDDARESVADETHEQLVWLAP